MRFCSFFGKLKEIVKLFGTKKECRSLHSLFIPSQPRFFLCHTPEKAAAALLCFLSACRNRNRRWAGNTGACTNPPHRFFAGNFLPSAENRLPNPHFLLRQNLRHLCGFDFFLLRQPLQCFFNALKIPFRIFGGCHQHHRHPNRQIHIRLHAHAKLLRPLCRDSPFRP